MLSLRQGQTSRTNLETWLLIKIWAYVGFWIMHLFKNLDGSFGSCSRGFLLPDPLWADRTFLGTFLLWDYVEAGQPSLAKLWNRRSMSCFFPHSLSRLFFFSFQHPSVSQLLDSVLGSSYNRNPFLNSFPLRWSQYAPLLRSILFWKKINS